MIRPGCFVCCSLFLFLLRGLGQTSSAPVTPPRVPPFMLQHHPDWPKARPEDVNSVDAIISSVGAIFSGPAGSTIDVDRFKSLFVPDARLAVVIHPRPGSAPEKKTDIAVFAIEDYVSYLDGLKAKQGTYEETLAKHAETFGDMTHVYASFQLKAARDAAKPDARGMNSYELLHSGDRYYIVQIYWDFERPSNPIPANYLP